MFTVPEWKLNGMSQVKRQDLETWIQYFSRTPNPMFDNKTHTVDGMMCCNQCMFRIRDLL